MGSKKQVMSVLPAEALAALEAAKKAARKTRYFTVVERYMEPVLGSEAMSRLKEAVLAYEEAAAQLKRTRDEARVVEKALQRALTLAELAGVQLRKGTALEQKLQELVLEQQRLIEVRAEADARITTILEGIFEIPEGTSGYDVFRKIETRLLDEVESQKKAEAKEEGEQQPSEAETQTDGQAEAADPLRAAAEALAEVLANAGAVVETAPFKPESLGDKPGRVGQFKICVNENAALVAAYTPGGWAVRRAEKARRLRKAAKQAAGWKSITPKRVMDLLDTLK